MKELLQNLAGKYGTDKLIEFFETKSDLFEKKSEFLPEKKDGHITQTRMVGEIKFQAWEKLVVIECAVIKELNERSSRKIQYDFAKILLKKYELSAGIFVFYDPSGNFRFSLIYPEVIGTKKQWNSFKRFTYFVSPESTNTTFIQRMKESDFSSIEKVKEAFSVEKVTKVFFEKYRDIFFDFVDEFNKNETFQIVVKDKEIKVSDFVKKTMGQIVFLYFLQKKGWLGVPVNCKWGEGDQHFIRNLFKECESKGLNFYNDYLEFLFYDTLGNRDRNNDAVKNDQSYSPKFKTRIPYLNGGLFEDFYDWKKTTIKIENGLFEKLLEFFDQYNFTVDENTPLDQEISIDPEMLGKIFERLLEYEDRKSKGAYYTPREIVHYMCQESIINYLITETGCQEERIRKLIHNKDSDLTVQFDETRLQVVSQMADLKDIALKVNDALKTVRILDPAVGSGAFPMGMLNEIFSARFFLNRYFIHEKDATGTELTEYYFKKETLENCIYGVDIDPGAIDIAKLRFWLSLVVEHQSDEIEPLPNLDYKLMQGNSLIEEYEGIKLIDEKFFENENPVDQLAKYRAEQTTLGRELFELHRLGQYNSTKKKLIEVRLIELKKILLPKKNLIKTNSQDIGLFDETKVVKESKIKADKLLQKQKQFFDTNDPNIKKSLKKEIEDLVWQLIEATLREEKKEDKIEELEKYKNSKEKPFFLYKLHFAEVFQKKGGFDIVIANPPYVRQEEITQFKESLKNNYKVFSSRADLYTYFYEKGLGLLNDSGTLTFITSNKFMRAKYGDKLRDYIQQNFRLLEIVDFGDVHKFEAITNTLILILTKNFKKDNLFVYSETLDLDRMTCKQSDLCIDAWTLARKDVLDLKRKIEANGLPLSEWPIKVSYGIKAGFNEAFVIEQNLRDEFLKENLENNNIVLPLLRGRDIGRYITKFAGKYIIFSKYEGHDLLKKSYPEIVTHLSKFEEKLKERGQVRNGQHHWLELDNNPNDNYLNLFTQPKIIWLELSDKNKFTYTENGECILAGAFMITGEPLKYLLAFLNSKLCLFYFNLICNSSGMDTVQWKKFVVDRLPVPQIAVESQAKFIDVVDKILAITKSGDYLESPAKKEEVKEYEHQIDQMVYKLYDLTPEEIKIVGGTPQK